MSSVHTMTSHLFQVVYVGVQAQEAFSKFEIDVSAAIFNTTEISINVAEGQKGQDVYDIAQHVLPTAGAAL